MKALVLSFLLLVGCSFSDSESRVTDFVDTSPDCSQYSLHCAAFQGRDDLVKSLLEIGANPNQLDSEGRTPLQVAIASKRLSSALLLIDFEKTDPNAKSSDGNSALHWSVHYDCAQCVPALAKRGVDLEYSNGTLFTPLKLSVKEDKPELVKALLAAGAKPNGDTYDVSALSYAVQLNSLKAMDALIANGVDINAVSVGKTALEAGFASNNAKTETLEFLFQRGGRTQGQLFFDILRYGVSYRRAADVDFERFAKLAPAELGAKNGEGQNVLHFAASLGARASVLSKIVALGFQPNALSDKSLPPLAYAVQAGRCGVIGALVTLGADPNLMLENGNDSIMHLAAREQCIDALLSNKGDLNLVNAKGESLLYTAIAHGKSADVNIVELLEKGANVSAVTNASRNVFHALFDSARTDENVEYFLRTLFRAGAKPNITSAAQCPAPLDLGLSRGSEVVALLAEQGADANSSLCGEPPLFAALSKDVYTLYALTKSKTLDIDVADSKGRLFLTRLAEHERADAISVFWKLPSADLNRVDPVTLQTPVQAYFTRKLTYPWDALNLALERGFRAFDVQDKNGRTVLMSFLEANGCYESSVKAIAEHMQKFDLQDSAGNTVLHYCARAVDEYRTGLKLLIEKGVDLNTRNKAGDLAQHVLLREAKFEGSNAYRIAANLAAEVRALKELGADLNAREANGSTLLHIAAERGLAGVALMLLRFNADASLTNSEGKLASEIASDKQFYWTSQIFSRHPRVLEDSSFFSISEASNERPSSIEHFVVANDKSIWELDGSCDRLIYKKTTTSKPTWIAPCQTDQFGVLPQRNGNGVVVFRFAGKPQVHFLDDTGFATRIETIPVSGDYQNYAMKWNMAPDGKSFFVHDDRKLGFKIDESGSLRQFSFDTGNWGYYAVSVYSPDKIMMRRQYNSTLEMNVSGWTSALTEQAHAISGVPRFLPGGKVGVLTSHGRVFNVAHNGKYERSFTLQSSYAVDWRVSAGGELVAFNAFTIRGYNSETGEALWARSLKNQFVALSFTKDPNQIYVLGRKQKYDSSTGRTIQTYEYEIIDTGDISFRIEN